MSLRLAAIILALTLPLASCSAETSYPAPSETWSLPLTEQQLAEVKANTEKSISELSGAVNNLKIQLAEPDYHFIVIDHAKTMQKYLIEEAELTGREDHYKDLSAGLSAMTEDLTEAIEDSLKVHESLKDIPSQTPDVKTAQLDLAPQFNCKGVAQQGGVVLCKTLPGVMVKIGRGGNDFYYEKADADGLILIGFDRDETKAVIQAGDGAPIIFEFEPRDYDISRIDGLPPSQVSTFSDAQLKRIRSSSARKKHGFSSRAAALGFTNGFISPVTDYRKTTNFGAQRILNGEPKNPHYGVDMAAPVGTPIYAPADGVVTLADDNLYFEGAMVLLDHGQGLISMYLHVNEMMVKPGQSVKQGQQIATIGSKGRSTGPHLCWRLKWRNRNLDPELLTQWPQ